MKILTSKILYFLLFIVITTNIILFVEIHTLPNRLSKLAGNNQQKDTVEIIKSDKLTQKSKLIYYKGIIINNPIMMGDAWEYNPIFPDEIWSGYMYLTENSSGAKYYLWSINNTYHQSKIIEGWFVTIGQNFQYKKEYLPMLIPIVSKTPIKKDLL